MFRSLSLSFKIRRKNTSLNFGGKNGQVLLKKIQVLLIRSYFLENKTINEKLKNGNVIYKSNSEFCRDLLFN